MLCHGFNNFLQRLFQLSRLILRNLKVLYNFVASRSRYLLLLFLLDRILTDHSFGLSILLWPSDDVVFATIVAIVLLLLGEDAVARRDALFANIEIGPILGGVDHPVL